MEGVSDAVEGAAAAPFKVNVAAQGIHGVGDAAEGVVEGRAPVAAAVFGEGTYRR